MARGPTSPPPRQPRNPAEPTPRNGPLMTPGSHVEPRPNPGVVSSGPETFRLGSEKTRVDYQDTGPSGTQSIEPPIGPDTEDREYKPRRLVEKTGAIDRFDTALTDSHDRARFTSPVDTCPNTAFDMMRDGGYTQYSRPVGGDNDADDPGSGDQQPRARTKLLATRNLGDTEAARRLGITEP